MNRRQLLKNSFARSTGYRDEGMVRQVHGHYVGGRLRLQPSGRVMIDAKLLLDNDTQVAVVGGNNCHTGIDLR